MTLDEFSAYVVERFDVFRRFARRLLRDESVALDVVQSTIVTLLPRCESIEREWADRFLFRCLYNQVMSHWRKARRPPNVPVPEEPSPDDAAAASDVLRRAWRGLNDEERKVVAAWWDAKGDRQEAMESLGMEPSPGKAGRYDAVLHRAKQKLAAALGPDGGLRDRVPGKALWLLAHEVFCAQRPRRAAGNLPT